jgi:hypothetical protein
MKIIFPMETQVKLRVDDSLMSIDQNGIGHQAFIWLTKASIFLRGFMQDGDPMAVFSSETEDESSNFVILSPMN